MSGVGIESSHSVSNLCCSGCTCRPLVTAAACRVKTQTQTATESSQRSLQWSCVDESLHSLGCVACCSPAAIASGCCAGSFLVQGSIWPSRKAQVPLFLAEGSSRTQEVSVAQEQRSWAPSPLGLWVWVCDVWPVSPRANGLLKRRYFTLGDR